MEDQKIRDQCRSLLPPDVNEHELWQSSKNTKQYLRKVQNFLYAKSPPLYVSPTPKVPSLNDILGVTKNDEEKHEAGIFNCRRCHGKIPNYRTEQRRSGDEGFTTIGVCPKCNVETVRNS